MTKVVEALALSVRFKNVPLTACNIIIILPSYYNGVLCHGKDGGFPMFYA